MSAAGSERVKVTQRKLLRDRAANSLSSTSTSRGNVLSASAGRKAAVKVSPAPRPWTANTPGRQTRGSLNPSGKVGPEGNAVGRFRRDGPTAAITTLDPSLNPLPE